MRRLGVGTVHLGEPRQTQTHDTKQDLHIRENQKREKHKKARKKERRKGGEKPNRKRIGDQREGKGRRTTRREKEGWQ
jgi:hypothetical protein